MDRPKPDAPMRRMVYMIITEARAGRAFANNIPQFCVVSITGESWIQEDQRCKDANLKL